MHPTLLHATDPKVLDLLKAIGVSDPRTVKRVILDVKVDQFATVYVERYVTVDAEAIAHLDVVLDIVEVSK